MSLEVETGGELQAGLLRYVSYTPTCPGITARNGAGPPPLIINQGNAPQTGPQANLMKTISQLTFPLPRYG